MLGCLLGKLVEFLKGIRHFLLTKQVADRTKQISSEQKSLVVDKAIRHGSPFPIISG
jgi:hypothetical protein